MLSTQSSFFPEQFPKTDFFTEVVPIINFFVEMIVGSALVYDLYFKKIPNYLLLTGYAGLAPFMYIKYGLSGVMEASAAVFLPGVFLVTVYIAGGLGAGDVKLICLICGYLGFWNGIKYTLLVLFIGAFAGVVKILLNYATGHGGKLSGCVGKRTTIRFSIPITAGYMIVLFSKGGIA